MTVSLSIWYALRIFREGIFWWILLVGLSDANDKHAQQFAEIYKTYHKLALKVAIDELHDPHQAQDIAENIFVKILEKKKPFLTIAKPKITSKIILP